MKFDLALDKNAVLAETPIWDSRKQVLYWTDLFAGTVNSYSPETKEENAWETGKLIGSAIPCKDDSKLLCMLEDGAYYLDTSTGKISLIISIEGDNSANRFNDSRVDAAGRLFTSSVSKLYGTGDYKEHMKGNFYMLDTDHKTLHTIVEGINQYNAIVWNFDNTKMLVVDTFAQKILCFEYDLAKGPISEPKVVIDLLLWGMPDGMCIDKEDNIYIFHWTGKITVWKKDYTLKEVIDFPVEYACCGGFGGKDMKDLYVASSKFGYDPTQLKNNRGAGGLFVARCEIEGCEDNFF